MVSRLVLALLLVVIVGVPFAMRPRGTERPERDAPTLVIITPHVQQIRYEFGLAFAAWHEREYGQPAHIDWRTPGGTSEIRKLLTAEVIAAARRAEATAEHDLHIIADPSAPGAAPTAEMRLRPGAVGFDVIMGGGSFEHEQLKIGITLPMRLAGEEHRVRVRISSPAALDTATLAEVFGENRIGTQTLYDPDLYWIGKALSGFGIVYNRDVLRRMGIDDPTSFEDLTDPRLAGWVALADPRQSGSITTTFDSILGNYGWDRGWRILRDMTANARYFTNSSTKPPIDISQGEAAMGLVIDFYGRTQAQAVMRDGETVETSRVGYTDPKGATYVDADPVSILNGGSNVELAQRFVRFCLTHEAQALWQYPARGGGGEGLGPVQYELRRMPIRRDMYAEMSRFIDKVNPFEIASDVRNPGWRTGVEVMMAAFGIETADQQRHAWRALNAARGDAAFPSDVLREMEAAFYAWPRTRIVHPLQHPAAGQLSDEARKIVESSRVRTFDELRGLIDARTPPEMTDVIRVELRALADAPPEWFDFSQATYGAVRNVWRDPVVMDDLRIEYRAFFEEQYDRVVTLHEEGKRRTGVR